jgi:hypothetical protein
MPPVLARRTGRSKKKGGGFLAAEQRIWEDLAQPRGCASRAFLIQNQNISTAPE